MKVSHEKAMWFLHLPILSSPHPYPNAVTVHQCSKMPQIHCLPSMCYTVFPVTPTPCVLNIIPLNPHLPPSRSTLPHPSPLVTTRPFLESLNLLFCSLSFASLLHSTNEENHLAFVFLHLAYFTEHNTLQLHTTSYLSIHLSMGI